MCEKWRPEVFENDNIETAIPSKSHGQHRPDKINLFENVVPIFCEDDVVETAIGPK